ncbi:hypothetical protein MMC30_008101 [Trapelia coarctata]|nr:hypothetical protein [Trapelia coarctata]
MESASAAEALIPLFKLEKVLDQDQAGRRITLLGTVSSENALLTLERAAFPSSLDTIAALQSTLTNVKNLGANDIYAWYLANIQPSVFAPDLKINLIYPCTPAHIKKYSPQVTRVVSETPSVYRDYVRPYMQRKREEGRLNWVYNIIEGRTEQEDIILRQSTDLGNDREGFLLLPDMNWDRKTMGSLRILGLVERRDLWSLRDLRRRDVGWLRRMMEKIEESVEKIYGVERDMLKLYVHYQPTYYHFHIHITTTSHDPSATQATLKAFSLPNLIAQLETLAPECDSLGDTSITYTIGEASELWAEVFGPLKERRLPESSK